MKSYLLGLAVLLVLAHPVVLRVLEVRRRLLVLVHPEHRLLLMDLEDRVGFE
jgi:hypothetical protein